MKWILAFHLIFVICWFAGLFYLPRLFVYHASSSDQISNDRFKIMERKLFWGIQTPSAILATIFGVWLLALNPQFYAHQAWMHIKLFLVILLWVYHILSGKYMLDFKHDRNKHSHVFYRWFNEVPVLFLVLIVILVVVEPSF